MNIIRQHLTAVGTKSGFALKVVIFVVAATILSVGRPPPVTATTIDFESLPSLPAQPNNFAAAGAMQTYNVPGVFAITGGVVLGNPTFLPAFPANGSLPNLYGTTDVADPSLLSVITLTFPTAENIVSVAGLLFNGQPITEDYGVAAFSGVAPVDSNTFTGMAESFNGGFGAFSLASTAAQPITSVTIATPNADLNGWDFLVDTITIGAAISPTPEPSTALLFLTGAIGLLVSRRRRKII